jgi:2-iminobutanoate/2-iminopropanoate deaminase
MQAANCTFNNVVKTTVLLADMADFNTVNEIYKEFFKENYPARAAYQVSTKLTRVHQTVIPGVHTVRT